MHRCWVWVESVQWYKQYWSFCSLELHLPSHCSSVLMAERLWELHGLPVHNSIWQSLPACMASGGLVLYVSVLGTWTLLVWPHPMNHCFLTSSSGYCRGDTNSPHTSLSSCWHFCNFFLFSSVMRKTYHAVYLSGGKSGFVGRKPHEWIHFCLFLLLPHP